MCHQVLADQTTLIGQGFECESSVLDRTECKKHLPLKWHIYVALIGNDPGYATTTTLQPDHMRVGHDHQPFFHIPLVRAADYTLLGFAVREPRGTDEKLHAIEFVEGKEARPFPL